MCCDSGGMFPPTRTLSVCCCCQGEISELCRFSGSNPKKSSSVEAKKNVLTVEEAKSAQIQNYLIVSSWKLAVFSVQSAVCSVQCAVCSVQCAVYSVKYEV